MKIFIPKQKGTTLVELLIYMGILSILLTILMGLFASSVDTQLKSESLSAVNQDGTFILQRLRYDIHRASAITTPSTVGATTDTLVVVIDGIAYTYSLNNSMIRLSDGTSTENINSPASTISNLSFTRLGNDTSQKNTIKVQFRITGISRSSSGPEIKDFETTIGIR